MLTGNGYFVWQAPACEKEGDPWSIVSAAVHAGMSSVIVKVSDGKGYYNNVPGDDPNAHLTRLVRALRLEDVAPWGFGYSYGGSVGNAAAEGEKLGEQCRDLGLAGCCADLEGEYEVAGSDAWAKAYLEALKAVYAGPLVVSSFWSRLYHPQFPWHTVCALCDAVSPQVYWGKDRDAALTLRQSAAEFAPFLKAYPRLQFFPTGAVSQDEGGGSAAAVRNFCVECDAEKTGGAWWWDMQEEIPSMLSVVAAWHPVPALVH